jgi:segregation and condensation protein B
MFDEVLLKKILEGALFAASGPMSLDKLSALFAEDERPDNPTLTRLLAELQQEYQGRGVNLCEVASGYRFQVVQETALWVSRLWEEKPARYSRALLETLALIAYRQPITRGEIEEIRGVSTSSQIVKTLLEREWVRVVGYRDVPGRPAMYATTKQFMDYFNLKSLDELPPLAEIRDLDQINAELDLAEQSIAVARSESVQVPADSDLSEQEGTEPSNAQLFTSQYPDLH